MGVETLTIHDAQLIFPTDFIQSIVAQQNGETYVWAAQDHVQTLLMETFKEDKQLKLAFASLNLILKDGLHVLDFKDLRLKEIKSTALSVTDSKFIGPSLKAEIDENPTRLNGEVVESVPKRKRGRPRKTEAEKQKSKNEEKIKSDNIETHNQSVIESTNGRYALRGVKLSTEIMNAEKGIYKAIKIKEETVESATESTGDIDREHSLSKQAENEMIDKANDECQEKDRDKVVNISDNLDENNVSDNLDENVYIGEGDSDDDFVPVKKNQKRSRGRTKTLELKCKSEYTGKLKQRKTIDIGNVPKFERRKRNNKKKEECKVCKKKFCDFTGLFNHVKKRHEKASCYQSYLDELKELMVATCEQCGSKFGNRNLLHAHEDREHRQTEIVECFRCHKSFRNIMNLRSHVRAVHVMNGDKNKLCHLCPAKFKWSATLKQHIDEIHEGNKHAKCQYCEKTFYSNSQLRRHERCHGLHQSKFVVCQLCGRKFLYNHNLKRHTEIMHGSKQETYHCSYCGRGYSTKTSMVSHVQLVHFNLFSYSCKQCSATFPRSKFLVDHMRTIHKIDNYLVTDNPKERYKYRKNAESALYCSYCSESFNYKAKLVNHIHTVHADVFPHHCDNCTQGFLELSFLTNHRLKAHGIAPPGAGDSLLDEVVQEHSNTVVVTTAGGDNSVTNREEIGHGVIGPEALNSPTMTLIETENQTHIGDIAEPAMTDTAAASLLVEVASGNKTYQYYIETQDPVGEDGTLTVNPEDIANVLMMAEQTIQAEGRGVSEEHSSVGQEVLGVTIQSEGGTLIEDHSMSVGQEVVGVTIQGEGGTEGVGVEQGIVIDYSQQDSQSGSVLVESVYSSHEGETIQETETIQEGETIIVQGKDTTQETNMVVQRTRTLEFGSIESNY